MIGIFITAAILSGSLWLIARHDADLSFVKILLISFGFSVVANILVLTLGLWGFPIAIAVLIWSLVHWCYISVLQAVIVTGIWLAVQIGGGLLIGWMLS